MKVVLEKTIKFFQIILEVYCKMTSKKEKDKE